MDVVAICTLNSRLSTLLSEWTHRESHPPRGARQRGRLAKPASSCWTTSPGKVESRELPCAMSPSCLTLSALDSPLLRIAGAGVEPASRRSECRILPLDDPAGGFRAKGLESRGRQKVRLPHCFPLSTLDPRLSTHLRGQESNLRTRRSKRRISTSRNYPATAEAVGLEPTIPIQRDTCFRDRPLIRPDDFHKS